MLQKKWRRIAIFACAIWSMLAAGSLPTLAQDQPKRGGTLTRLDGYQRTAVAHILPLGGFLPW